MALLFIDGFDHSGTNTTAHDTKYSAVGPQYHTLQLAPGAPVRTGTGSMMLYSPYLTDGDSWLQVRVEGHGTGAAIMGVALHMQSAPVANAKLFEVREGASIIHMILRVTAGAQLQVVRGDGTVLATGSTVLVTDNWYYIEFKTVLHDTTGSYKVRIDGVDAPGLSATNVDTQNSATGLWDRVRIGATAGGPTTHVDDLYVADGSGSAPNNDLLGICRVETLLPQTGNGFNAGLTTSSGTDHGALVDEVPPNTTDFNASAIVGAKDTYNYPALTLAGSVLGIQTNLYVNKSDVGPREVCPVLRVVGVDYDGASVQPLTTYTYLHEIHPRNPSTTLGWTVADVAALEAGMKITV
jgi:hypothetical protein